MAVAVLLLGDGALAVPKKHSSVGRVAKVVTFPAAHPLKTVKGFLSGALNSLGVFIDGAEYVTGEIAKGAAKVDSAVDTLETQSNPAQKASANGKQHPDAATP